MNVGEVWAVDFPFEEDITRSKNRPCIIIDVEKLEVLVIKVTTYGIRDEYDIPIYKWREANLPEPSYARASKSAVITKNSFIYKYGMLDQIDFKHIINAFMNFNS